MLCRKEGYQEMYNLMEHQIHDMMYITRHKCLLEIQDESISIVNYIKVRNISKIMIFNIRKHLKKE